MPETQASISPLDRGFMFGDGVYEVIPVYRGKLFCFAEHIARLQNSCEGIRLDNPCSLQEWQSIADSVVKANAHLGLEQSLYIQVTRGAPAVRDHLFPDDVKPTVFVQSKAFPQANPRLLSAGASLISTEEIRWNQCHLKTTSLVANVLLKQLAHDNDADEVLLIRDGYVQECSVSNFFLVKNGIVKTPAKSHYLLPGITRDFILSLLAEHHITYLEAPVTETELYDCDEIWICSSTKEIVPATRLNNKSIGNGKPGKWWSQVYELFQAKKYE